MQWWEVSTQVVNLLGRRPSQDRPTQIRESAGATSSGEALDKQQGSKLPPAHTRSQVLESQLNSSCFLFCLLLVDVSALVKRRIDEKVMVYSYSQVYILPRMCSTKQFLVELRAVMTTPIIPAKGRPASPLTPGLVDMYKY